MFLAIDECFGTSHSQYVTIGCLSIPQDNLSEFEKEFIENRMHHKLWGEIKWSALSSSYLNKYKEVVSSYLGHDKAIFHSWTYKRPTTAEIREHYSSQDPARVIYQQAYILIRTVIWRCRNVGYNGDFYILADQSGFGSEEYQTTMRLLQTDSKIRPAPEIPYCNVGNSISCGALQIADICTGATHSYYDSNMLGNTEAKKEATKALVSHLEAMNGGLHLNTSRTNFYTMYTQKLHHGLEDKNRRSSLS